ncbi:hypothetical protein AHP1_531 [Aeromonas phage Ahp1_CNU-2021]|nr:hypothetical protein AHP1_531 [Aeromonas phage Ahp1_CNU-2021]
MKKTFMEILVESLAAADKEFVGKFAVQDKDGTFHFFADRPSRKLKTHHWDSTMGPIDSLIGTQLYSDWHGSRLSRVGYDSYTAYMLRKENNEDV